MVSIEYRNAYSEVLEILRYISEEELNKIPEDVIKKFKENANKDYYFSYTPDKTLDEQSVSKTAKYIIAILFRDYWATPNQREIILNKEKYDLKELENKKREKYDINKVLKKTIDNDKIIDSKANKLVEYKENTIWNKIRKILEKINTMCK